MAGRGFSIIGDRTLVSKDTPTDRVPDGQVKEVRWWR